MEVGMVSMRNWSDERDFLSDVVGAELFLFNSLTLSLDLTSSSSFPLNCYQ